MGEQRLRRLRRPWRVAGVGVVLLIAAGGSFLAGQVVRPPERAALAAAQEDVLAALGVSKSAAAQVSQRLTAAALDEVRVTLPGGAELLADDSAQLDEWIASARALPHVVDVGYLAQAGAETASIRRLSVTDPEPGTALQLISADPAYLRLIGTTAEGPDTRGLLATPRVTAIALLGTDAARSLSTAAPGPGSSLWINDHRVAVVGTLAAGARSPGIADTIVVSGDVLARSPSVAVTMLVGTEPGYSAPLAEALPLALDPGDPGRFTVETVADLRALRSGVSSDLGALIALLAAVLLALATLSAAATMSLSVQARAPEIALRRAIGASRTGVARLFLCEGLLIGVIGGVAGAVVGTAATLAAAGAQGWTAVLPPSLIPLGIALGALTGIVSAIVAALAAGRQEPANAIRGCPVHASPRRDRRRREGDGTRRRGFWGEAGGGCRAIGDARSARGSRRQGRVWHSVGAGVGGAGRVRGAGAIGAAA
ncbi:ABC transporter permease [Rathayibacter sp. VKM Ac-2760]|uniref:ABC transporter permease n=1 Tax=Rathayibacter sp. VKM Ac-2760 TaxID=2609253 RepID=UPI001319375C|nr:ABC transporter permease [Rathayibacter sp. VKM Ac-2760]QHC57530.1 FtsX-like permease family protein [Rathayibacter sp. VKM Ac-2760]